MAFRGCWEAEITITEACQKSTDWTCGYAHIHTKHYSGWELTPLKYIHMDMDMKMDRFFLPMCKQEAEERNQNVITDRNTGYVLNADKALHTTRGEGSRAEPAPWPRGPWRRCRNFRHARCSSTRARFIFCSLAYSRAGAGPARHHPWIPGHTRPP